MIPFFINVFENGEIFKRYLYEMLKLKEITSKWDKKNQKLLASSQSTTLE
jgi:hypothetical protein